ncbi:hypothetical protein RF657_03940 [Yersinia rochesterensis]|nr:hypothetical protein [Yersinia rochesterensis]MDR5017555.1 hypothetical protein [Yersinia rochesterensis]
MVFPTYPAALQLFLYTRHTSSSDKAEVKELLQQHHDHIEQNIEDIAQHPDINETVLRGISRF